MCVPWRGWKWVGGTGEDNLSHTQSVGEVLVFLELYPIQVLDPNVPGTVSLCVFEKTCIKSSFVWWPLPYLGRLASRALLCNISTAHCSDLCSLQVCLPAWVWVCVLREGPEGGSLRALPQGTVSHTLLPAYVRTADLSDLTQQSISSLHLKLGRDEVSILSH